MHFLVDASLPRSAAGRLGEMGHLAVDVRDIGFRSATDEVIASHAQRNQQTLVTRDFDFADIRNYPPADYAGIVVLSLPDDATAAQVVKLTITNNEVDTAAPTSGFPLAAIYLAADDQGSPTRVRGEGGCHPRLVRGSGATAGGR